MNGGWFRVWRGHDFREVARKPHALALLMHIAERANWSGAAAADGLELGEARIGDYQAMGMTRQEYRTAISNLQTFRQVTIRTTNRGTVAKLINTGVCDPFGESANQQNNPPTTSGATSDQPLTKKGRSKDTDTTGAAALFQTEWNKLPKPFPRVLEMDDRAAKLRTRLGEAFFREHWQEALAKLPRIDWMSGRGTPRVEGRKPWVMSADYFLKPGSVAKIMEAEADAVEPRSPGSEKPDHPQWRAFLAGKSMPYTVQQYGADWLKTEFFQWLKQTQPQTTAA